MNLSDDNIHVEEKAMHIRTTTQLQQLTQTDYIRWRAKILTEIALQLAQRFTHEELRWVIDGRQAMCIVRSGYNLQELRRLEENAGASLQNEVFYDMADSLRCTFHPTELVCMDGDYDEIFVKALNYSQKFLNKKE